MSTLNQDTQEIEKFDQLADQWWDINGPMQALHAMNPPRLAFIEKQTALHNQTVLDVGCGAGLLSEALAKQGAIVTGIDLSPNAIRVAKAHAIAQSLSIDYHCQSIETLPNTLFDVITCLEMLEHIPDPCAMISTLSHYLKPGGSLIISTINRTSRAFFEAILGAEYLLNLLPIGTHHYANFIRPSEMQRFAKKAQLDFIALEGLQYQPFKKTARLCKAVCVNYLMAFQKQA